MLLEGWPAIPVSLGLKGLLKQGAFSAKTMITPGKLGLFTLDAYNHTVASLP